MAKRISKKRQQEIGLQRIHRLFTVAEEQAKKGNITVSNNAVRIARKIAMKTTVSIPKEYKHLICKHCYQYLYPPVSCRVRLGNNKKTITCFHCKKQSRYPYKPRKQ